MNPHFLNSAATCRKNHVGLYKQSGKSSALLVVLAAFAVGVGVLTQHFFNKPTAMPKFEKLLIMPKPKSLGAFSLTDHEGHAFTEANLANKWTIMFFAFTNCPDVCPNTLHTLKQVKQDLVAAETWSPFQLAMVSVDPERDTPQRLKQYLPFFDPEFIGLTGDLDFITKFAKNLGILFFKKEVLADGNYDVDHSAGLILVNPQGQFAGFIGAPHKREVISADLSKLGKHILAKQPQQVTTTTSKEQKVDTSATLADAAITSTVDVVDAWIRPAPPSAVSMAGYMTISNHRETPIIISKVESPLFNMSMIHETVIENGIASMNHRDNLKIDAKSTVTLAPMGLHMMMMGPKEPLNVGRAVPITLFLENNEALDFTIEVRTNPAE